MLLHNRYKLVSFGILLNQSFDKRFSFSSKLDNDGEVELVIGYSDRKVRAFKWSENEFKLIEEWTLAGLLGSVSWCNNPDLQSVDLIVSQPGGTYCTLKFPDSLVYNIFI